MRWSIPRTPPSVTVSPKASSSNAAVLRYEAPKRCLSSVANAAAHVSAAHGPAYLPGMPAAYALPARCALCAFDAVGRDDHARRRNVLDRLREDTGISELGAPAVRTRAHRHVELDLFDPRPSPIRVATRIRLAVALVPRCLLDWLAIRRFIPPSPSRLILLLALWLWLPAHLPERRYLPHRRCELLLQFLDAPRQSLHMFQRRSLLLFRPPLLLAQLAHLRAQALILLPQHANRPRPGHGEIR